MNTLITLFVRLHMWFIRSSKSYQIYMYGILRLMPSTESFRFFLGENLYTLFFLYIVLAIVFVVVNNVQVPDGQ